MRESTYRGIAANTSLHLQHSDTSAYRYRLKSTTALNGARAVALATALSIGAASVTPAFANPGGGTVVGGDATIVETSATRLDINQSSDKAIINWHDFSIAQGEHTNFNQPGADSIALNRVTGGDPSAILGQLSANGIVMLLNPNGVLFGASAQIDVAGILATTADIADSDFMAGALNFNTPGNADATVINRGNISVADGGMVALVAPGVENSGVISARLGRVSLASGNRFTVDFYGDSLIEIAVDDSVAASALGEGKALIEQNGSIAADGGVVMLTAAAAKSLVDNAINMDGIIQAQTAVEQNGEIVLLGGDGAVSMTGDIDVSGGAGFVEVSGADVSLGGSVDLSGGGHLVIDPPTFDVDAAAAATIVGALAGGSVDVEAEDTITVNADIDSSAQGNANTLNFKDENANNDLQIDLNAEITLGASQTLTGDGTTVNVANTSLIQNGVDVAASGGTVNVAAGQYDLTKTVTLDHHVNLIGAGSGTNLGSDTILNLINNQNAIVEVTSGGTSVGDQLVIGDLRITETGATSSSGIKISNGDHVTIDNVTIDGVRGNGVLIGDGGLTPNAITDINIKDSAFIGTAWGGVNAGAIQFFIYEGDASIEDTTIDMTDTGNGSATYGIQFRGKGAGSDAGTVTLDDVTMIGTPKKVGLLIQEYDDISNISLEDVDLSGVNATWNAMAVGHTSGTAFDIGDTILPDMKTWDTGGVDATGATFSGTSNNFEIEDVVYHALDETGKGLVTWVPDNVYVTLDSGSIQRGIDAVNSGGTVNIDSGTFTAVDRALAIIDKPLTLAGAGQGLGGTILDGGAYGAGEDTTGLGTGWVRGIVVQSDDVTIQDMRIQNYQGNLTTVGGYAVVARTGASWGVAEPVLDRLTVQDVAFVDDYYGLRAQGVNDLLQQRTTYGLDDGEGGYATYVSTSTDTVIRANTINNGSIWVTDATNALIGGATAADGNVVTDAPYNGIWLGQQFAIGTSSDGTIRFNTVTDPGEGGIVVWNYGTEVADGIQILDNTITGAQNIYNEHGGISIQQGEFTNLVIARNTSSGNSADAFGGLYVNFGTLTSATIENNFFTGNATDGIRIGNAATLGDVSIIGNDLSGNGGFAVNNLVGGTVNASGNWWGSDDENVVAAAVNGSVDFTPFLTSGTDTDGGTTGFQGDFSDLFVTTLGAQTGATGRVQEGIDMVSGSTVHVGAGTFREQVVIDKDVNLVGAGQADTNIESPDLLDTSFVYNAKNRKAIVTVKDGADATVKDLTVDGRGQGNANNSFVGIGIHNADADIDNVRITRVRDGGEGGVLTGAQHGIGILAYNEDGTPRTVTFQNGAIDDFQKNASAFVGPDLEVNVLNNVITGAGPTTVTAQNGIQFNSASGLIQGNTISGIAYTGGGWLASNILLWLADDVTVDDNTVTGTNSGGDAGIYSLSSNNLTVSDNTFDLLEYHLIVYPGDDVTVTGNDFDGGGYGLYHGGGDDLVVSGNTFNELDYSIILTGGKKALISWNEILGGGVGQTGIFVGGTSEKTKIVTNTITGHATGIEVADDAKKVHVHFNKIYDNDMNLVNTTSKKVDAKFNWWGTSNKNDIKAKLSGKVKYKKYFKTEAMLDVVQDFLEWLGVWQP